MKRRGSPRIANSKKKKQTSCPEALMDSVAGRLGFVLELEAGQVCAFLLSEEILYLLQACSSGLSKDFIDKLALKALDQFADETRPTWDASVTVTGYEVSTLNDLVWRSVLAPYRSL
ncbi:hypothetical protein KXD40_002240 [Peronospora effusa]|nr:hypothetical protein KXD40_002240 [Peronospora effusa]